jgi:hypothetical protein
LNINDIIPPPWQFVTSIGIGIGILIAIVTATIKITRSYDDIKGKINVLEDSLHRLEEHPLLGLHKKWASSPTGVAAFYGHVLESREIEEDKDE